MIDVILSLFLIVLVVMVVLSVRARHTREVEEEQTLEEERKAEVYFFTSREDKLAASSGDLVVRLSGTVRKFIGLYGIVSKTKSSRTFRGHDDRFAIYEAELGNGYTLKPIRIYTKDHDGQEGSSYYQEIFELGIFGDNGLTYAEATKVGRSKLHTGEGKDWFYESSATRYKFKQVLYKDKKVSPEDYKGISNLGGKGNV